MRPMTLRRRLPDRGHIHLGQFSQGIHEGGPSPQSASQTCRSCAVSATTIRNSNCASTRTCLPTTAPSTATSKSRVRRRRLIRIAARRSVSHRRFERKRCARKRVRRRVQRESRLSNPATSTARPHSAGRLLFWRLSMPKPPLNEEHADNARRAIAACDYDPHTDVKDTIKISSSISPISATPKTSTSSWHSNAPLTPGPSNASIRTASLAVPSSRLS